ncbi:MAG: hypothetical protein ACW98D_07475 [Promethearchaeota archaeon]
MSMEKVKKGPVCYVYYAIKKKRQLKLEQKRKDLETKEISAETEIILNPQ